MQTICALDWTYCSEWLRWFRGFVPEPRSANEGIQIFISRGNSGNSRLPDRRPCSTFCGTARFGEGWHRHLALQLRALPIALARPPLRDRLLRARSLTFRIRLRTSLLSRFADRVLAELQLSSWVRHNERARGSCTSGLSYENAVRQAANVN